MRPWVPAHAPQRPQGGLPLWGFTSWCLCLEAGTPAASGSALLSLLLSHDAPGELVPKRQGRGVSGREGSSV